MMKIICKICLIVLSNVFLSHAALAINADVLLNEKLKNIHSYEANFTQTIIDDRGRDISKSSGKMLLQRPGNLRWYVLKPTKQLVVAKKNKIWIYDPELEQVVIRKLNDNAGDVPALLLSQKNITSSKYYSVTQPKNRLDVFELTPKKSDGLFAKFKLVFENNLLVKMVFIDKLDQITVIEFKDIKFNPKIKNKLFEFVAPNGTDTIDETRRKK